MGNPPGLIFYGSNSNYANSSLIIPEVGVSSNTILKDCFFFIICHIRVTKRENEN